MESPGEETGRVVPSAPHTPAGPQPNGANKIIGRNVNGTSKSRSAINLLMFYIFCLILNAAAPFIVLCVMWTEYYKTFTKLPAFIFRLKKFVSTFKTFATGNYLSDKLTWRIYKIILY